MAALRAFCYLIAAFIVLAIIVGGLGAFAAVAMIGGALFVFGLIVALIAYLLHCWVQSAFKKKKPPLRS